MCDSSREQGNARPTPTERTVNNSVSPSSPSFNPVS